MGAPKHLTNVTNRNTMADMKQKRMYRITEVAELLGVTRVTVWRWCKDGKLPHVLLPSGQFRISQDDIEQFMNASTPYGVGASLNADKTISIKQWREDEGRTVRISIDLADVEPLCNLLAQLKLQAEES